MKDCWWDVKNQIKHSHPITSFSFRPVLSIIFIGWVFFHFNITPDGWALWLFYLITYSCPKCMFCIVWCQQISICNKQIESSIYLIKQVWFFKKIWWSEKEQGTQKIKILNWGTWEHRDSFHRNKRTGAHWEGLNIFSFAEILCAQTMTIICIRFWYDKNPFSLHVSSSYKTV